MKIEIKKTDESTAMEYNTAVIVELLNIGGSWKIAVPHIVQTDELICQLSSADDLVDKYADILSAAFKKYDYKYTWKSEKYRFICSSSTQINKSVILPSTIDISNDFAKYGISRKMWAGDDYFYCGYGTVVDGKLLSWCIENSHYRDDGSTEIGVQTDEDNRKNGYAVSNVVALCDCLRKKGISSIYYECDMDNITSYRTAEKANLEYIGKVHYLCFRP